MWSKTSSDEREKAGKNFSRTLLFSQEIACEIRLVAVSTSIAAKAGPGNRAARFARLVALRNPAPSRCHSSSPSCGSRVFSVRLVQQPMTQSVLSFARTDLPAAAVQCRRSVNDILLPRSNVFLISNNISRRQPRSRILFHDVRSDLPRYHASPGASIRRHAIRQKRMPVTWEWTCCSWRKTDNSPEHLRRAGDITNNHDRKFFYEASIHPNQKFARAISTTFQLVVM